MKRLPSNLGQTTHECVYFRSRDKYDGRTIRPKTARAELLPLKVSYYGNRKFQAFCSCDLDFDPTTFIHERDVIGVDRIFSGCTFFLKKLTTFLLVILNTNGYIPTSTLQLSPAQQKCSPKFDFLLRLAVHLQITPINYAPNCFSPLWGCTCTQCTPDYAYMRARRRDACTLFSQDVPTDQIELSLLRLFNYIRT